MDQGSDSSVSKKDAKLGFVVNYTNLLLIPDPLRCLEFKRSFHPVGIWDQEPNWRKNPQWRPVTASWSRKIMSRQLENYGINILKLHAAWLTARGYKLQAKSCKRQIRMILMCKRKKATSNKRQARLDKLQAVR